MICCLLASWVSFVKFGIVLVLKVENQALLSPSQITASRVASTSFTVTVHSAVTLGFRTDAAVTVQVPAPTALISPSFTVATASLELRQVHSRLTTVQGFAETSRAALLPLISSMLVRLREISLISSEGPKVEPLFFGINIPHSSAIYSSSTTVARPVLRS